MSKCEVCGKEHEHGAVSYRDRNKNLVFVSLCSMSCQFKWEDKNVIVVKTYVGNEVPETWNNSFSYEFSDRRRKYNG